MHANCSICRSQVVKATVLSADPEHNRLRLSLASATAAPADAAAAADAAADALEPDSRAALQPGSFATGVISSIVRPEGKDGTPRPPRYIVNLSVEGMEGTVPGQLEGMQLSDHPVGASALQDTLQASTHAGLTAAPLVCSLSCMCVGQGVDADRQLADAERLQYAIWQAVWHQQRLSPFVASFTRLQRFRW